MLSKSLALGADHAGFEAKENIRRFRENADSGIQVTDVGTFSSDSVDYPDFAHQVAVLVGEGKCDMGILICGSGNGVCITANRHKKVRAALCWTKEIAALARQHNDANVLCLPSRFVSQHEMIEMTETFLNTEFEGGRHLRRAEKIEI